MEKTPKNSRKSLSLQRLKSLRRNHRVESSKALNTINKPNKETELSDLRQSSTSVASICSDRGIECTPPPHRNSSLDDSIDYSPQRFDSGLSPSQLLSQTLASDSPEVGWRWGRRTGGRAAFSTSPDSAYAAESSFLSVGSSSTESAAAKKKQHVHSYDYRREEQRKAAELELRRRAKAQADEMLKQRCVKLQEQLRGIEEEHCIAPTDNNESTNEFVRNQARSANATKNTQFATETIGPLSNSSAHAQKALNANETLNDFFNDSASDWFLLEATQQLEPQIIELTQSGSNEDPVTKAYGTSSSAPTFATPTSSSKEKRSSMYLKFLEDDLSDDWFLSLDEAVLQATQPKKPRTSLQRYKSLPSTTISSSSADDSQVPTRASTHGSAISTTTPISDTLARTPGSIAKMKRHASSHSLTPSNPSHRGRQLPLIK